MLGEGQPKVLLYGDSNAAHYIGVIGPLAEEAGVSFRNYAHSACIPLDIDPEPFVSARRLTTCRDSHVSVAADPADYDLIFLGASWIDYARNGQKNGTDLSIELRSYVQRVTDSGARVVLMDTVPIQTGVDPRCGQKALKLDVRDCASEGVERSEPEFTAELRKFAEDVPNVSFLSLRDVICEGVSCPAHDPDETSLYFDRSHLSAEGSWRTGRRLQSTEDGRRIVELLQRNAAP